MAGAAKPPRKARALFHLRKSEAVLQLVFVDPNGKASIVTERERVLDRARPQKFAKTPHHRKKFFSPPNPLKTLKTAKEKFAKIWRKQALFCEYLDKKLGGLGPPCRA